MVFVFRFIWGLVEYYIFVVAVETVLMDQTPQANVEKPLAFWADLYILKGAGFLNIQREQANPADPGPGNPHCKTDAFMSHLLTDRPGNHRPVGPVSNVWSCGGQQTHVCHKSCDKGLKSQSSHTLLHLNTF